MNPQDKVKKILWLDTETTGLSPYTNDVIQIGYIVEYDGLIVESGEFKCQPWDPSTVTEKACEVHGMSVDEMMEFEAPIKTYNKFNRLLDTHINRFDKTDKFIMAGYNVGFDFNMMQQWWKKAGASYWGSYFEYKQFDVYPLVFMYAQRYGWDVVNHKLETIAPFLGIEINAHDAVGDIMATRDVYMKLTSALPLQWDHNE
jgi:DNA polymerase-3 subunit epsilon